MGWPIDSFSTGRQSQFRASSWQSFTPAPTNPEPARLLALIAELLQEFRVIDFDSACAKVFGQIRGTLQQRGISVPTTDLMIASVALHHDLTLVTHNTVDYRNIPGLRLDDWLSP